MEIYSIYIHIPFCRHRCTYCDFNTYSGVEHLIPEYVAALQREIIGFRNRRGKSLSIATVYFGGGTPSLLDISFLAQIIQVLNSNFHLLPNVEISLEANPGTLSQSYLSDLIDIGINRISLGMQSANSVELSLLGRQHDFENVIDAVMWSRNAGFENINLDLMFGIPGQDLSSFMNTLSHAIRLNPEHISLYSLSIEPKTRLKKWINQGLLAYPDDDLSAAMYEKGDDLLSNSGYIQYEISNWAKISQNSFIGMDDSKIRPERNRIHLKWACRHNLQYWRNLPYVGFGAGAHGYIDGYRIANVPAPMIYIEKTFTEEFHTEYPQTPVTAHVEEINKYTEMAETMFLGLRLTLEGVSRNKFYRRFEQDYFDVFNFQIKQLLSIELIEWVGQHRMFLRLTPRGRLLANRVFREFVGN
jgi:oxygen-independent coproporphyrinogen-3 oxidase